VSRLGAVRRRHQGQKRPLLNSVDSITLYADDSSGLLVGVYLTQQEQAWHDVGDGAKH
jgi:hypothetical protein